jgi:hypothetical protein
MEMWKCSEMDAYTLVAHVYVYMLLGQKYRSLEGHKGSMLIEWKGIMAGKAARQKKVGREKLEQPSMERPFFLPLGMSEGT